MNEFQAELELSPDGKWKVSWLLPQPQNHVLGFADSPAGLEVSDAKTWANDVLIAEKFVELWGWRLPKGTKKYVMRMTM